MSLISSSCCYRVQSWTFWNHMSYMIIMYCLLAWLLSFFLSFLLQSSFVFNAALICNKKGDPSCCSNGAHPAAAAPQATEAPGAPLSELHGFVLSIMTFVAYYLPLLLYIPSLKKQKLVQGSLVETMQSWWGSGRPCSSCLLWERKSKPKTKH